ncbi:12725_t:CDS:2 [Ambispora gerdemannii]|uniref:12725_t:CDS:1 n=1 Tax=Ambispora gerdemannii TaxID=144530 RepID=A0A9N9FS02_9GLOM|nr:12725_t:CDS:2 [Ambispora gerdemannii]
MNQATSKSVTKYHDQTNAEISASAKSLTSGSTKLSETEESESPILSHSNVPKLFPFKKTLSKEKHKEFNDSDSANNAKNINIDPNLNDIYEITENNETDDNTSIIFLPSSISTNSTNQSITSTIQTKGKHELKTKPKTSYIWNYFKQIAPDTTVCQVLGYGRRFTYHKTTSTMKTHLSSILKNKALHYL